LQTGHEPGFYIVVSRSFIAENDDMSTAVCAPIYRDVPGLRSEVVLGIEDGLPRESAVRCDFLTLMFERKLTNFVGALTALKIAELNRALAYALELTGRS
jgi:mRNA interferase MazF